MSSTHPKRPTTTILAALIGAAITTTLTFAAPAQATGNGTCLVN
jgi:hypothetical protein